MYLAVKVEDYIQSSTFVVHSTEQRAGRGARCQMTWGAVALAAYTAVTIE